MNKKIWLASFKASSAKGRFHQLQFVTYLSFVLNIVLIVTFLFVLWELRI